MAQRPLDAAIVALVVTLVCTTSAFGSTIDVRCASLPDAHRAELSARARLLLSSAGMETASISVECDATGAWLVWTDGKRSRIDPGSGLVEGALDAIESRIAQGKRAREVPPPVEPSVSPGVAGGLAEPKPDIAPSPSAANASTTAAPATDAAGDGLEGGVGLSTLTEFWSGSAGVGLGPRLDVAVKIGPRLALVVSEGARFGVGSGEGEIMAFDLQLGVAFGAPYLARTGVGVVFLAGAERLAAAAGSFNQEGLWAWSATASLGGRASLALGPINAWAGIDGMLRSTTLETGGQDPAVIPTATVSLSLGCFLPALAGPELANATMAGLRAPSTQR